MQKKRSEKWPSIKIYDFTETKESMRFSLTNENSLALATEILKRAESGDDVRLRFVGRPFRRIFIQEQKPKDE